MSVDDDEDQALPANHRNKRYVLYQLRSDKAILEDIRLDRVPNPNLNESASWRRICEVRGRYLHCISEDAWRRLCARRARVKGSNPDDL